MNNIREYIESGVLEAYVLGSASEAETHELLRLKEQYPEVQNALTDLEIDMERIAQRMAIPPRPGTWQKIEDGINGIIVADHEALNYKRFKEQQRLNDSTKDAGNQYIEVEAESDQMRVNKAWKWVFITVFILGKIFLACAIYFYLENRQAQQQILELKTELREAR